MTKINLKFKASDFAPDEATELFQLNRKRTELIDQIRIKAQKSDRFRAALDVLGHTDYGGKNSIQLVWDGNGFTCDVKLDEATPEAPAKVSKPYVNLTEKTLNSLLNGKILTDGEKRSLVDALLPDGILADGQLPQ